ncbi:F0F1 ATP synthase subunit alpha [Crenobacter sp. SG2303]|uniref:F0F1 ATP synthase subunit alpha n=1 Tax=Crenobacter oryzisoli TaxID=3056844 RepID=A0ABT7XSB4_9NEIS|nr:F0F1 ATP synthase subunit alpha [Crenobacter sp. SG2303]MDN0076686.1 F0F1 ATP synthase subunit alpha [Crenobacter sp. SG2303]
MNTVTPAIGLTIEERGEILGIADGIAWISGLPSAQRGELLDLEDGSYALADQLDEKLIGAILLHPSRSIAAGTGVRRSGRRLTIPGGDTLLGRVVDPLGRPLDGLPAPQRTTPFPLEAPSPSITARTVVSRPLYSGNTIIDTLLPIGRGQRQLIIGDDGTGKSALALDAVIHQIGQNVRCVYVLIGQRRAAAIEVIDLLTQSGALAHTTVVVAEASALPGIQYLAPFAGCALAEGWMRAGHDVLIVFDDLGQHAQAYRELSLLLRRPPGREAYPGDIFYLHSRLLERATALAPEHGGGSLTALPIVPTQLGELAAYIPTNLISITDGQIYLSHPLFAAGILPAIDIGRSVSRIGGKAQDRPIAREAGRLRLDYLQFLELEMFTRFGTRLEPGMSERVARGHLLRELFRQGRLEPRPITYQMAWLIALNQGWLDGLDANALVPLLAQLARHTASAPILTAPREQWIAAVSGWLGRS